MSTAAIAYLGVFCLGLLTLAVSFLMSGRRETGGEADERGSGGSLGVFSVKVLCCFIAGFGSAALLSYAFMTSGIPHAGKYGIDIGCGLGGGLLAGGLARLVFRSSRRAAEKVVEQSFVGVEAPLTLGVPQNGVGVVIFDFHGRQVTLEVRSASGKAIAKGAKVRIVSLADGIGVVEQVVTASWKDMSTGEY